MNSPNAVRLVVDNTSSDYGNDTNSIRNQLIYCANQYAKGDRSTALCKRISDLVRDYFISINHTVADKTLQELTLTSKVVSLILGRVIRE